MVLCPLSTGCDAFVGEKWIRAMMTMEWPLLCRFSAAGITA